MAKSDQSRNSKSKKEGKDQESIQSGTTSGPVKVTTPQLDITNESQEVR